MKKIFIDGKIDPAFIAEQIQTHQSKTKIGAHSVFLGQVRSDVNEGKRVRKIIYTAYREMAEKEISKIREFAIEKFRLSCLHVFHSLGEINTGEISFFVFASAPHRENLFEAVKEVVELIKSNVPIWKKEIY